MIIGNVTGGMQDQMRFVDENGEWYTPSFEVPSNHMKTYNRHGKRAVPVFPSNISLVGSVPTPYIFDDRCDFRDVAAAIREVYDMSPQERELRGTAGREWALSEESMMSAKNMGRNIIKYVDKTFEEFVPRTKYDILKIQDLSKNYVKHPVIY
jgi:hypothetical protein